MINKKLLKRYIDRQIRLYLDINMFEIKTLSELFNLADGAFDKIQRLLRIEKDRSEREYMYDMLRIIIHKIRPNLNKAREALEHGDMPVAEDYLKQLLSEGWKLQATKNFTNIFNSKKFEKGIMDLIHSFHKKA